MKVENCKWIADSNSVEKNEQQLDMVAPFYNYVKQLRAILGADPEVTVLDDEENRVINICVAGCDKPSAYRIFFPGTVILPCGKVTILVNGHKKSYKTITDERVLADMFHDHPLVKKILVTTFNDGDKNRLFVIFKNKTVQFKNDNFGSLAGVTTTTAEALAKEVLDCSGAVIWWSTDTAMIADVPNEWEKQ